MIIIIIIIMIFINNDNNKTAFVVIYYLLGFKILLLKSGFQKLRNRYVTLKERNTKEKEN